jgi:hypothetical protein
MSGWGGARPGAGAPRGGISDTSRILRNAIKRGLAHAGATKYGIGGDIEEQATQTAAMIVSDMVLAGEGAKVIDVLSRISPRADDNGRGGSDGKSPLTAALERMAGKLYGAIPAQSAGQAQGDPTGADSYKQSAPDPESGAPAISAAGPYFAPQLPLLDPAAGAAPMPGQVEGARGGYPPSGPAPDHSGLDAENFENFSDPVSKKAVGE